jgi:hypothetical protein
VYRPSEPVQVETGAPLLRVVLALLVLLAVFAGVLVASRSHAGWVALGLAVLVGPVAVMIDGRSRRRSEDASASPSPARPEQLRSPEQESGSPRRAA